MILLAALDKYVWNEWVNLFKSSNKNFLLSQDHHLPLDLASLLSPLHQILHPDARCQVPGKALHGACASPSPCNLPPRQTLAKVSGAAKGSLTGDHPCVKPSSRTEDQPACGLAGPCDRRLGGDHIWVNAFKVFNITLLCNRYPMS